MFTEYATKIRCATREGKASPWVLKIFSFVLIFLFFLFFLPITVAQAVTVENVFVDTTTPREKVGYPAISDPSSKIVFPAYSWTTGGLGETLRHGPIAAGGNSFISNKAEPAATVDGKNRVYVSIFDLGVEPWEKSAHFLETGDSTSKMQWLYLNNKPSGIFNYQWYRSSVSQSIDSYCFTYQDRFYGKHTLNGINYFGFSIQLKGADSSNNLTGAIDTSVPGQPIITVYDAYSGYYVAFGASQVDQYYVDSSYEDPRYDLNTEKTSTTDSATYAGLRAINLSGTNDAWNYVFAMDRVKATAIASVRSGLNNFDSDYTSAQTFWQGYLNDTTVDANLTPLTEREKYDACVALNQLAANSYNQSYLAAGTPIFSDNFARDTAYAALGLYYWKPTFAKDVVKWFAQDGWPSLVDTNAVDIDGVAVPGEYPTDWGAVYMYAAGKIYKLSGDTSFANTVKTQLNSLYDWVHARYNATDKHIDVSSIHTHDYWDQYAAEGTINTSLIKYEAEIDMLWALALENAADVWTAVGDTARASWATQTAVDLQTELADYRTNDNGFYFGIKTDNSLYSDFVSAPTNLIAGRFMDDLSAFNYLTNKATDLSLAGIPWVNIGSTTYKNGVTNLIDIGTWFEISWGILSKRWGDGDQYNYILTMTGLGYVPGSLCAENNDFIVGQHIENQSWSYGMLLGMIYDNNVTYPVVTETPTATTASTGATITWNTKNNSSSIVDYGLTSSYGSSTTETDTSTRVSSHTVNLSNLLPCAYYHYRVRSRDVHNLAATGSDSTFTTSGCTGSASVSSQTDSAITSASGGNVSLLSSGQGITLTVPASFFGSDANFQIKQLEKTSVTNSTSTPTDYSLIGSYLYDLKALTDVSTTISSFNNAITVSIAYGAGDVSGINESGLKIYRWDGSIWNQLSGCSVNTSAKTVSCTTISFSVFGLFGQTSTSSSSSSSSSTSSSTSAPSCGDQTPGAKAPWLYGAIAQSSGSVLLYFTEADNLVNKYVLEYGTKSGDYPYGVQDMGVNSRGQMTFLVKSLSPNTIYYFRVRGGNGCATGPWSNEISAKTKGWVSFNQLDITQSELEPNPVEKTPKAGTCQTYTVKSGDTLWVIAKNLLGDGNKYKEIIEQNKEQYSSLNDSNNISRGWELKINCGIQQTAEEMKTTETTQEQNGYDVKVKVIDTNKKPVEGAKVTIHSKVQETITNKDGIAEFKNVEAGDHRVLIAYKNFEGEQSVNLTGDVKEFDLNVTIQQKVVSLSALAYGIIGIMTIIILALVVLLIKAAETEI